MAEGLVIDDLARRFGGRWAVARVSLTVPRGTVMMLTGANGSGKTTLLRCLATALRPHHGRALFDGQDLWQRRASMRPRIAFLSHQLRLYDDLSARDNLGVWADLGGLRPDISALLTQVGLETHRPDPVRTFSARMLLRQPDLVLMDEPFSAFDPPGQQLIRDVVRQAKQRGATVVITTHVPEIAQAVCDTRVHLDAGQIA